MSSSRGLAISILCLSIGCGGKSPAPDATGEAAPVVAEPTPAAPAPGSTPPPVQPPTSEASEASEVAEPPPAAAPEPGPERAPEPQLSEAQRSAGLGSLQKPVPATLEWVRLRGVDDLHQFEAIPRGVLSVCLISDDSCELSEAGKVVATKYDLVEPAPDAIMGSWPDNAWFVETTPDSIDVGDEPMGLETLVASNWTNKKWREKNYEFRFKAFAAVGYMGDRVARASWSGGLIVCHVEEGRAFNALEPDKTLASFPVGDVWTTTQTASGKLLVFRTFESTTVRGMQPCLGDDCQQTSGYPVRLGDAEEVVLRIDVSRGGDAMSFLFENTRTTPWRQALLHYDVDGSGAAGERPWIEETIENIEGSDEPTVKGMWGDPLGGLWLTITVAELLYRSPGGVWFSVAPPEGVVFESFAMRTKPPEFLAQGSGVDGGEMFAARGPITPRPDEPLVMPTPTIEPAAPVGPDANAVDSTSP